MTTTLSDDVNGFDLNYDRRDDFLPILPVQNCSCDLFSTGSAGCTWITRFDRTGQNTMNTCRILDSSRAILFVKILKHTCIEEKVCGVGMRAGKWSCRIQPALWRQHFPMTTMVLVWIMTAEMTFCPYYPCRIAHAIFFSTGSAVCTWITRFYRTGQKYHEHVWHFRQL